ncbi:MAG: FAD-dependent thymidylate synthase [Planctomycetota bacterium]|jgi:thymidylate synthase (FAD)
MPETTVKVTLVQHTPNAAEVVAAAAKVCYASKTDTILEQDPEKAAEFVEKLRNLGHMSPIEHASFTFYIEGVSRALTHQLVRHRLASYSQRSQRYVRHADFDYVVPDQFRGKTVKVDGEAIDAVEYYRETMALIGERYETLAGALGNEGESTNEDARYVLPNACETKIFVTMNARELLHFFEERLCQRAQWEIRAMSDKMLTLAREACPALFKVAGPKCVRMGKCPEGKMTCGLYREMVEKYGRE